MSDIAQLAARIRGKVVQLSHQAGTPHLGSSLSCADLVASLYGKHLRINPQAPQAPDRDRFILSKGHAATTLYAALALQGFFPEEELEATYAEPGSRLPEHPSWGCVPGVEASTGSLGHGLSIGLGIALAHKIQKIDGRVIVLVSDGECNEGSVWEAAMTAPALGLTNLCVVVDANKWQATGRSAEVLALEPLHAKFEAFGWECHRIDGHDLQAIDTCLSKFPSTRPFAVVADTIKGKGVSFMEDDNNWHYRIPTADEVSRATAELGLK